MTATLSIENIKRTLATLLAFLLLTIAVPLPAFAEGATVTQGTTAGGWDYVNVVTPNGDTHFTRHYQGEEGTVDQAVVYQDKSDPTYSEQVVETPSGNVNGGGTFEAQ
jgi:hypothetical protein